MTLTDSFNIGHKISKETLLAIERISETDFHKDFAAKHVAPRLAEADQMNISLIMDVSSVELFADDGLTVMTEIFFPNKPFNKIHIQSSDGVLIKKLTYAGLRSIWH